MLDMKNCFTYAYSDGTYTDWFQSVVTGAQEVSTNVIDLDSSGIVPAGGSKPPWWIVKIGTAADTCTSLEIKLITATNEAATAGVKAILNFNFLQEFLTAGALIINVPLPHFKYQQYLAIEWSTVGSSGGACTAISYLSDGPEPAVTDIATVEAD